MQIQAVVVAWQVYDITRDPLSLAYVGLAQFLPMVVLLLPAGDLVDRFERKRILQASWALQAVCSGLLLWLSYTSSRDVSGYYAVLALFGCARAFTAGIGYIRAKPIILGVISLDLFAVLLGGVIALLPIYAQEILHVGPQGLGALLMGVYLGVQAIRRHVGWVMFAAVAMFGAANLVFALSETFWLSMAALVIAGAADMISVNIRLTLLQLATPDDMRGRVNAVNMLFIGSSNELGEFRAGTSAAWFGVVPAAVIGGVGTLAVVGLWLWGFAPLRRVDRFEEVEPAQTAR
ncbi:hypothetical protein GCM10023342_18380 [Modicisalibacter zincidurans]|uniref:MFS transporter n=1 Tax=Modicisalibacter zincidurans TaxID=1178777 RepID=A0ABP9RDE0_9GAMM